MRTLASILAAVVLFLTCSAAHASDASDVPDEAPHGLTSLVTFGYGGALGSARPNPYGLTLGAHVGWTFAGSGVYVGAHFDDAFGGSEGGTSARVYRIGASLGFDAPIAFATALRTSVELDDEMVHVDVDGVGSASRDHFAIAPGETVMWYPTQHVFLAFDARIIILTSKGDDNTPWGWSLAAGLGHLF